LSRQTNNGQRAGLRLKGSAANDPLRTRNWRNARNEVLGISLFLFPISRIEAVYESVSLKLIDER
jgi:hypothetical protein